MSIPRFPVQILCVALWNLAPVSWVDAGSPALSFDFARVAECHISADDLLTDQRPYEKIVELKLRVSVHLLRGAIEDVEEVRIEVTDCDRKVRVHSFDPGTRLESALGADIEWTKTTEGSKSLGASIGGAVPVPAGELVAKISPSLSGGLSNREVITEVQQRLAPQQAVVASGTVDQEHGVFFKLRNTPQNTLEGTHDLSIRFVVPQHWRGDAVRVCCYAVGYEKILWIKQQTTWAELCAPVTLYLAGDEEARRAAERQNSRNQARSQTKFSLGQWML